MAQTDLSIEEIRSYIADAVADSERQSNSRIEELLKMFADLKKQREPGVEKPDASVEAIVRDEARSSSSIEIRDTTLAKRRNLVVCIDGTANQFGIKASSFSSLSRLAIHFSLFLRLSLGTLEFERCRTLSFVDQGFEPNHFLQQRYWNVCSPVLEITVLLETGRRPYNRSHDSLVCC